MRIAVASDHAGFWLKGKASEYLTGVGHNVEDLGTNDTSPLDYPDFAEAVAAAIHSKRAERAVLLVEAVSVHPWPRTSFGGSVPACVTTRTRRTRA